jgi:hypothetical protein
MVGLHKASLWATAEWFIDVACGKEQLQNYECVEVQALGIVYEKNLVVGKMFNTPAVEVCFDEHTHLQGEATFRTCSQGEHNGYLEKLADRRRELQQEVGSLREQIEYESKKMKLFHDLHFVLADNADANVDDVIEARLVDLLTQSQEHEQNFQIEHCYETLDYTQLSTVVGV